MDPTRLLQAPYPSPLPEQRIEQATKFDLVISVANPAAWARPADEVAREALRRRPRRAPSPAGAGAPFTPSAAARPG
jgi:hypothetical protein